jgi:hypothetical protein
MRLLICLIAGIFLTCFAGCKSTTHDAVSVDGGRVEGQVSAPVQKTSAAARKVAVELKLTLVQYTADDKEAHIVAYTQTTQRIEITIRAAGKGSTVVVQTEGQGGDLASTEIMARIRKEL